MASHHGQITHSVEQVYAEALVEMAEETGELDSIHDEVNQLAELIRGNADLGKLLASRLLSETERRGCIERIFKGRVSDLLYRFIQIVSTKSRLADLSGILSAFGDLVKARQGIVEVNAYVATPMDQAHAQRIAEQLGKALDCQVVLKHNVDPSLIGGLKLRVGDRLVDGSVAAQLRRLKEKIIAGGQERAREDLNSLMGE